MVIFWAALSGINIWSLHNHIVHNNSVGIVVGGIALSLSAYCLIKSI